ncbi:MAG TPA: acetyl-CoA acetyltransferase [Actinomycetota bacterium]
MADRTPVIAGVAESALGITNRTILDLQAEAVAGALDDAGLALRDVDGLFTTAVSRFSVAQVAEYLGIVPTSSDGTMAGGSSYEMFVAHAAEAIRAGHCEVALISYANNQRSAKSRTFGGVIDEHTPEAQFEQPYAPLNPISLYAMAARRHMHEFGTTSEQLAEVAVAARAWALRNPVAFRYGKGPLTVEDVLGSEMISDPLHALDCCLITDGGGAVVMTTAERARHLPKRAVRVLGHGEATTNQGMASIPDLTDTGARVAGTRAYAMAGLGPGDVDVAQVYDSFTITVLTELEALGFCERGEAGSFVEGGRIAPGGDFPMNTSGGGLSYCHPGVFGILLVVEAVRQLRGECGERQVPGAEVALCHGTGGILSTHATVIVGLD